MFAERNVGLWVAVCRFCKERVPLEPEGVYAEPPAFALERKEQVLATLVKPTPVQEVITTPTKWSSRFNE